MASDETITNIIFSGLALFGAVVFGSIINEVVSGEISDPIVATSLAGLYVLIVVGYLAVRFKKSERESQRQQPYPPPY